MTIGGFKKFSVIEYPGHLSAVIFLKGCNFRCPYCYNKELVKPKAKSEKGKAIPEKEIFEFLKSRKGLLDAVCITGGEPTLQKDLKQFCKKIKKLGFKIMIETNGSNPDVLEKLIKEKLIDAVALDIKTSPSNYQKLIGKLPKANTLEKIKKSIDLIKKSNIFYEFRTTCVPEIVAESDLKELVKWIGRAKRYVLQQFRPENTLEEHFEKIKPYSDEEIKKFVEIVDPYFKEVELRGVN